MQNQIKKYKLWKNRKKQICNAMLLKWKGKNILYGFRTWKNYVVSCKLDNMKQDHEKTVLELNQSMIKQMHYIRMK